MFLLIYFYLFFIFLNCNYLLKERGSQPSMYELSTFPLITCKIKNLKKISVDENICFNDVKSF